MQQSQPRTWTWKGANHDYHQKFWKSILNKQGPLHWACPSTEFLIPNVMAIPQWKNVYNALPSSKILSFSYSYFSPKKTRCVIKRTCRKIHSESNQQLPLWITASNFETKSQAIEAGYEEHIRGEKNMGNWVGERRSRW